MNKELREKAKRIGNPAYRDNESTCYTYDELDELITLILDEVKESILENHRNKCFKLDANFEVRKKVIGEVVDIIDNLRGSDSECISDGGTCGLGGYCAECPHVKAIDNLRGRDE